MGTKIAKKNNESVDSSYSTVEILPFIPLRDLVLFPGTTVPLFIGRMNSKNSVRAAMSQKRRIFLAAQKDPSIEIVGMDAVYSVGVVAEILQMLKLPDGTYKILVETLYCGLLTGMTDDVYEEKNRTLSAKENSINKLNPESITHKGKEKKQSDTIHANYSLNEVDKISPSKQTKDEYLIAQVEPFVINDTGNVDDLRQRLIQQYQRYQRAVSEMNESKEEDLAAQANLSLVHLIAGRVNFPLEIKQQILAESSMAERMNVLTQALLVQIALQELDRKIHSNVTERLNKSQKDYYLGEKIKEIRKELGQEKDISEETDELRKQIEAKNLPLEAKEKALREVQRLEKVPPFSGEVTVLRNYIDWILDLPWSEESKDNTDLVHAQEVLDRDHYGLEKIKDRIIDFIVVRQHVTDYRGPILCFVGPPGVGKTSLAKSIADSLERQFIRVSLGGVKDEAEIRGHRKTYIGALPGRIIQSMKKSQTINPVFLLDEVDKLSSDFRGDPSSALLEVLDPEQNKNFSDHYLEISYDLSKVLFITTANAIHRIPPALRDRMEIIQLNGYSELDKMQIGRQFLLPRSLRENGLDPDQLKMSDARLLYLIRHYTREAGVRSLERVLQKVARKTLRHLVESGNRTGNFIFKKNDIHKFLGKEDYRYGHSGDTNEVGYANGLAWTEMGGDLLGVEVTLTDGRGGFMITGNLGDVMQESVKAAMTYFRSHAWEMGISPKQIRKADVHVHIPEGAIPKDGPSAGITIATAIISAFTGIPIRRDFAMTGEITLRGKVLPVGGIKEKVLAALRGKIRTVLLPEENRKDKDELPPVVNKRMKIILVKNMADVLTHSLVSSPFKETKTKAMSWAKDYTIIESDSSFPSQIHQ